MSGRQETALTSLLTALVALGPISTSLYVPSMPALTEAFATDPVMVQRSFTIFLAGFAIAQLAYGPLSDRFGRRPVLFGGLLLYIAASLACALSTGIGDFLAARLVQGIGACAGPVVGRAIVRDCFDRSGAVRAFAFIGTAIAVAPALGPLVGGFLEVWFGWQAAFYFLVAYGGLMFWLVATRLAETIPERDVHAIAPMRLIRNYRSLLANRQYVGHLLPGICAFGGLFAYTAASPFLFVDRLGLTPDVFGSIAIISVTGFASGSFLAGRNRGRFSSRTMIAAGLAALVTGATFMTVLSGELTLARVIGPMFTFVFGLGLLLPDSSASALHPFPRIAGSASAMMGFLQMAVGAAGSLALSRYYDGTAESLGLIMLVLGLVGALGYAVLTRESGHGMDA